MEKPGSESRVIHILAAAFRERIPLDLRVILIWVAAAIACTYLPIFSGTPLALVLGLPLVLFIPGYLVIASLFPGKGDIDFIERIALSFGLSVAIVPLIGLGLNYTPWGIRLEPVLVSLAVFDLACAVLAHIRRATLPKADRYEPAFREMVQAVGEDLSPPGSRRTDRILSWILLLAIVVAIGTTLYVIAVPREGERFTEFFILGEKKMAGDYPERIIAGQNTSVYIGIGNHENRAVNYTVETYLLDMQLDKAQNTSRMRSMELIDRSQVLVGHNETTILPYSFIVPGTGYYRIEFLLFNETVPAGGISGMDRVNLSYRDLHLWVTVYPR